MARSQQEASIAQIMASRTGTDPADWFLVFKARYGMQVAFEEIYAEMGPGEAAQRSIPSWWQALCLVIARCLLTRP